VAQYGRAVLGGTFDRLHVGHEALLATALRLGRSAAIGVTTDAYLALHPKPDARKIQSYAARRRAVHRWLSFRYPRRRWTLKALDDTFGGSVEEGVDVLVVSAETATGGQAVNDERVRRGLRPVALAVVPLVLADDLSPVSSRRIRAGDIDRNGRRRSRIGIGLSVERPEDFEPVGVAVRRAFPRAQVRPARWPPPRTGSDLEQIRRAAIEAVRDAELGIAIGVAPRGRRRVAVRSLSVELEPVILPTGSPAGLDRLLRRSAAAKRFSPGSG